MSNLVYTKAKTSLLEGGFDLLTDTLKVALVSSSYTVDGVNDQYWSTASSALIASPVALTGVTVVAGVFKANSVTFPSVASGSTVAALVLYKDTGTPSTSPLLIYVDVCSGLPFATTGSDINVVWNGSGIIQLS